MENLKWNNINQCGFQETGSTANVQRQEKNTRAGEVDGFLGSTYSQGADGWIFGWKGLRESYIEIKNMGLGTVCGQKNVRADKARFTGHRLTC